MTVTALKSRALQRQSLFLERAAIEGQAWAARAREQIWGERRSASGGWPGTMTEARAHITSLVLPWMSSRGLKPATDTEREQAARALYASARNAWLTLRDREEEA